MKLYSLFDIPEYKRSLSNVKALIISTLGLGLLALIIDYVSLPVYNLHDMGFIFLVVFYLGIFALSMVFLTQRISIFFKAPIVVAGLLLVASFTLQFLSSEFLNAQAFRDQITLTEVNDFASSYTNIALDKIPLIDQETSQQLGDKQIGKVQGLGSQFNIDPIYTLITRGDSIYRVSPLEYQDFIKWFQNKDEGIPNYVQVNVTDPNDVQLVSVNPGIKYSPSAFFDKDLYRHVRFSYRTDIIRDFSFETDDEGHPYYVVSVVSPEIGWFGGLDTQAAIVVDAVSGDMTKYAIEEVPSWVDRVQPADLAWAQIDNWGYYVHGFINTLFGQKDMIQTTDGYNYVSINHQTYVFSGLTSVGADRSIVGFSLINLKTKEAQFIRVGGADEISAMNSAQGQVQDLGYASTFPVLLNIQGIPTYFISLKDEEGLIKLFAMVNVQDYSLVGVADTVQGTLKAYTTLLSDKNLLITTPSENIWVDAIIRDIKTELQNGNTVYFLRFEQDENVYKATSSLSLELIYSQAGDAVRYQVGDEATSVVDLIDFDNLNLSYK